MQYGDGTYGNALRNLITNPGSFQGTPGFQFALNNGMDGIARQAAARGMNNSGNVLGDMTKFGTGLAMQDYGNQIDRLGKLSGQEQTYDLGMGQNANTATRNANDFTMGTQRNNNDFTLGNQRNNNDFNLGMYDATNRYDLGLGANQNTANRNQNDLFLGQQQNANTAANNQNQFNLGMYHEQTGRGNSLADIYFRNRGAQPNTFQMPGGTFTNFPRFN